MIKLKSLIIEKRYAGNLGVEEMFKFYDVATPQQKAMFQKIVEKDPDKAWQLVMKVLKIKQEFPQ